MKNIVFIGLGKQNTQDHLQAAQKNKNVNLVAVCDTDPRAAKAWGEKLGVRHYSSVESLIKNEEVDAAVVAIPHFAYLDTVNALLKSGIHVLKEKPFAMDLADSILMADLATKHNVQLSVAVQRKYSRVFRSFQEYVPRIGELFSIHGEYTLNIAKLDEGWRASKKMAGGGAVIDMGYHLIDLITWYFGLPDRISADLGFHNRLKQDYDVEDTAKIQFAYNRGNRKILGSLLLSRIYPQKDEGLFIYGTDGAIKLFKDRIELYDNNRELVESKYIRPDGTDIGEQFDRFIENIDDPEHQGNYRDHICNMVFIDSIYRSDAESRMITPSQDEQYQAALRMCKQAEVLSND